MPDDSLFSRGAQPAAKRKSRVPGKTRRFGQQVCHRIERHFEALSRAQHSLVVGVFGEWGSGKSRLLEEVFELVDDELRGQLKGESRAPRGAITVPVRFNPWRYEKEEHLVVPLLKVTEQVLEGLDELLGDDSVEALEKTTRAKIRRGLRQGARTLGVAVIALLSGLTVNAKVPKVFTGGADVLSGGVSGKSMVDTARGLLEQLDQDADKVPNEGYLQARFLESLYFDFEKQLRNVTRPEEDFRINLLFLVDDLDRCLPEKAVEMLETIKLFLDIPGCAFVMALDDEIVERGIAHRYRDYAFNSKEGELRAPVTGAEYLEKIVQVPLHLPELTEAEVRGILVETDYFAGVSQRVLTDLGQSRDDLTEAKSGSRGRVGPRADVLELFVRVVPWVPRKLLRATESLQLYRDLAAFRGWNRGFDELTAARLVLLQLFAPEIYRYARRRDSHGAIAAMAEWAREESYERACLPMFAEELEPSDADASSARVTWEATIKPLFELLCRHRSTRSRFEPLDLFRELRGSLPRLAPYFSLVEERITRGSTDEMRVADIADPDAFLDQVFARDRATRAFAFERGSLEGAQLSDALFKALLQRARDNLSSGESLCFNLDWLEQVLDLFSPAQVQRFYRDTRLLKHLSERGVGA